MKIILEDRFEASLNKIFYFYLFGEENVIFSDGDNNVKSENTGVFRYFRGFNSVLHGCRSR